MAIRELSTGTVTFLFSDIEGSTLLLQELEHGYVDLLERHNRIFREVIREHDGPRSVRRGTHSSSCSRTLWERSKLPPRG